MSDYAYTDIEMDLMCANAEAKQWRERFDELKRKYEELLYKHEELQNLFVQTDDELREYQGKFVKESLKYDALSREMTEVKSRISTLEAMMRSSNG